MSKLLTDYGIEGVKTVPYEEPKPTPEELKDARIMYPDKDDIMREKFEANLTMAGRAKTSKGTYANNLIENQWKGFKWGYAVREYVVGVDLAHGEDETYMKKDNKWSLITK